MGYDTLDHSDDRRRVEPRADGTGGQPKFAGETDRAAQESVVDRPARFSPRSLATLAVGLAAVLAVALGVPSIAPAQIDRAHADLYRQADNFLEEEPERAYDLVRDLPALPRADDLRLELLARSALRTGRPEAARGALEELREESDSVSTRFWAGLNLGELHLLGGEYDRAAEYASRLERSEDDLDVRAVERRHYLSRLLRLRHDLALARDDEKRARRFALELQMEYPAAEAARNPGLTDPGSLDASQRFVRAKSLYGAWSYREARHELEKLRDHPRYGDNARWYLGHIALDKLRDDRAEAEELFTSIADDSPYAPEALYNVARAQMRQEDYESALATLDEYEERYPGGRRIESVYYYRGWLPYDRRQNDAAIEGFKSYIDRYGKEASRSSYIYGYLSWTYMRLGEWRKAIRWYDEMESFGNMLVWGKALYWQAHAYRELGEDEEALAKLDRLRELYPVTYYGVLGEQLRARIEGDDPRASQVWWPEDGGGLDDSPRLDVTSYEYRNLDSGTERAWERVKALVQLRERERARATLDDVFDELRAGVAPSDRDAWIHAVGAFVDDYSEMWAVSTGGTISAMSQPPEPDELRAAMAYPRAYRDVVEDVSSEFDIPPYLMWSIMRQESRYRPAQISHTNAVGALQMIPKTARKVADDLGTTYNPRTFYKPEIGFRFSGYYMKKLLKTFEGRFVPMAAAYNSGPDVVAEWFDENPDASFPWLIEEFAYNEGRNYCRKVAEHMVRYLYLYEEDKERRDAILDRLFPLDRDIDIPEDVGY